MVYDNGVITQVEMAQFGGNVIKEISQQLNCCASHNLTVLSLCPLIAGPSHYVTLSHASYICVATLLQSSVTMSGYIFSCPSEKRGDSSTHWLTHCHCWKTLQESHPRDLWPLRHLIRVMRRHEQTKKRDSYDEEYRDKDNDKDKYRDKDSDKDKYI